jgi:hypothetical protein
VVKHGKAVAEKGDPQYSCIIIPERAFWKFSIGIYACIKTSSGFAQCKFKKEKGGESRGGGEEGDGDGEINWRNARGHTAERQEEAS